MFGVKLSKKYVTGLGGVKLYMMIYADHRKLSLGYVPAESSVSEVTREYVMNQWSYAAFGAVIDLPRIWT